MSRLYRFWIVLPALLLTLLASPGFSGLPAPLCAVPPAALSAAVTAPTPADAFSGSFAVSPTLPRAQRAATERGLRILSQLFKLPRPTVKTRVIGVAFPDPGVMAFYIAHASTEPGDDEPRVTLGYNTATMFPRYESSFIHEVGHLLDHSVLEPKHSGTGQAGDGAFASSNRQGTQMGRWWRAVSNSQRVKDITAFSRLFADDSEVGETAKYWLTPTELFARSFAQYVTDKSGDPVLLAQMQESRHRWSAAQWSDDDFKPIAAAFDELFTQEGWLRKK